MSTKQRWKFAINWVNDNYKSITSYLHKCLNSVCMDKDDYINIAYETAFKALNLCIKKKKQELFENYFWMSLKKFCHNAGLYFVKDSVYLDDTSYPCSDESCKPEYLSTDDIEMLIKKAINIMTPQQQIIWQTIYEHGYGSSYEVAQLLGISRQAVNRHLSNSLARVKEANLLSSAANF